MLVTASADGEGRVWELATGRLVQSTDADEAVLSPDGKSLFAKPGTPRAVRSSSGRELRRVETGPGLRPQQLAVSPDGKSLAFLSHSPRHLRAIVDDTATLAHENGGSKKMLSSPVISHSPATGDCSALAGPDAEEQRGLFEPKAGSIRSHDVAGGAEMRRIAIEGFGVASVAFAPDGKTLRPRVSETGQSDS